MARKKMKTRYKILILIVIIIVIIIVVFFTVTFESRYEAINAFYLSTQISDKEKLCNTIHGRWDSTYNTCDFVEDVKCLAIGGEPLNKPDEWRCLDLNDCVMEAMDIPTCHFEELVDEGRRIELGPANDPKDSFPQKYDAVIEGSIQVCMGHKTYPVRSQCEIHVDSYIKFDGKRTGQFTALVYDATLIPEFNTKAVFGLEYHTDENYYEIVDTGFSRK